MAKKASGTKVVGSALGGAFVPGMSGVQAYKFTRDSGRSRAKASAAGAAGAVAPLLPGVGTAAGAYIGASRSMQKQLGHKAYIARGKATGSAPRVNNDVNKAVARSKTSSSANTKNVVMHTRTKGRVGKK